jgi:GntR family transcriptional repressor for pyruvate dehydrogenase complex
MAPNAETIKRSTTADKVFDILHQWITSGRLQEGDVLPSQDELSRQLAVSRNTLREAIFKLSALGLVQVKQGVGTVVESRSSANYLSGLQDHLLMDRISMREFLEARVSIETTIVRLAVARASQEDIDRLDQIIARQREAIEAGDEVEFVKHDVAFHGELGHACGNRVMLKISQTVYNLLRSFITTVAGAPGNIEQAFRYHRQILAAIKNRDAQAAEKNMVCHLQETVKRFQEAMEMDLQMDWAHNSEQE